MKASLVALNSNNNDINDSMNMNMLNMSDDDIQWDLEYEMSDDEYDLYYHNELFVEYNSNPTLKRVHNRDLAPIILLVCNLIRGQSSERPLVI